MKRVSAKRARTGGTVLVVLAVLIGASAFGWFARSDEPVRTAGPGVEPLAVPWSAVAWEPGYTVTRSFVGRVEARQSTDAGFEVPGMIAGIDVEEGDAVASGAVIATLDDRRLRARRDELVADRDRARAQLELARLTLGRVARAHEREAATQNEKDEAEKAVDTAAAELARADAAVVSIDVDLDKTAIRSPFDAVVARRYVDTGRVVDAGTPVVHLLERPAPEVRIGVGGDAIDAIAVGQRFGVVIRDRSVPGEVTAILPTRDRVGRGVDVVLTLDAELDGIRQGDLARVRVERPIQDRGFWVPTQALTEGVRGLWSVYLIEEVENQSGRPVIRRADVEVLHTDTDRAYVRGALDDGERYVTGGLHRLAPGMTVRPADTESIGLAQRERER